MKIFCIADTQRGGDLYEHLGKFDKFFREADLVVHLGDGVEKCVPFLNKYENVVYIKGNHDRESVPGHSHFRLRFENLSLLFVHGERDRRIEEKLDIWKNKLRGLIGLSPDLNSYYEWIYSKFGRNDEVVVYGHVHIPKVHISENVAFFCPGGFPPKRLLHGELPSAGIIDLREKRDMVSSIDFSVVGYDQEKKKIVPTLHKRIDYE